MRVFGALVAAILASPGHAAEDVSREYQVKAAFLYNFTKFVEWPPQRFDHPDAPIVIGVVGGDPFHGELEKTVRDRRVNGRGISVVFLRSPSERRDLHVLFVPAGTDRRFAAGVMANRAGVLTVGESEQFLAESGIVRFTTLEQKVHFEINPEQAEHAGLKISAQLLKLATLVRPPAGGRP